MYPVRYSEEFSSVTQSNSKIIFKTGNGKYFMVGVSVDNMANTVFITTNMYLNNSYRKNSLIVFECEIISFKVV